jgi:hypothetical protein
MGLRPIDGYILSLKHRRENSFLQYSLVFKHQADEEVVCVNRVRAALSCFETCRENYLSCPFGKIVKHRPQNNTSQMRFRQTSCSVSSLLGHAWLTRLIGNYLTTDQVLAVGGIQFQSEPLRKRNHLVELRMLHHATVTMSR